MITTNIETVPGRTVVEHYGIVQGSTIRAKHLGRDFAAGLKNIVGGELRGYTELLQESRDQAFQRMIEQAHELGPLPWQLGRRKFSATAPRCWWSKSRWIPTSLLS